jgi:outer membrane protein TolC
VAIPDRDYVLLEDAEHTYFKITATVTQPIYTSGKLKLAEQAAGLDVLVAERELESKEREIKSLVRSTYFGAVFAGSAARLLTEASRIAADIVTDRELAFDEGVITRAEVLEAVKADSAFASQAASTAEAEQTARAILSALTGIDLSGAAFTSGYRSELPDLEVKALVARGLGESPARAALLHRIDQARLLAEIERAGGPFRPDVSINLSLDVTGQRVPVIGANWLEYWDSNLILTVGTSLPLFDSGAANSRAEQADYTLETARQAVAAYELGFELQVRQTVEEVRSSWHTVSAVAAELEHAREVERNAQVSFENELLTRAELLGAKLGALSAELEYERARYSYETALGRLEALVSL